MLSRPNASGWMLKATSQHTHQPRVLYSASCLIHPFAWGFIFELVSSGKKEKSKQKPDQAAVNKSFPICGVGLQLKFLSTHRVEAERLMDGVGGEWGEARSGSPSGPAWGETCTFLLEESARLILSLSPSLFRKYGFAQGSWRSTQTTLQGVCIMWVTQLGTGVL